MSATRGTSASHPDDSIEDIKDSLDRIEELLTRGHQLLYGEENAENALSPLTPKDDEQAPKAAVAPRVGATPSGRGAPRPGAVRPIHVVSQPTGLPSRNAPAAAAAEQWSAPRKSRAESSLRHQRLSAGHEEDSLSIHESAARIRNARAKGRPLPNLEEGIDENDVARSISLDELKARIHRELEEYRRNGPVMKRTKPVQKSKARSTAAAAPPKKGQARADVNNDSNGAAARQPPRSSLPAKRFTAAPRQAQARASRGDENDRHPSRPSAPTKKPAARSMVKPAPVSGASPPAKSHPPARGAARSLGYRDTQGPADAGQPRAATADSTYNQSYPQGRQPFWVRLYNDAAVQQEKLERMREDAKRQQELRASHAATNFHRRVRGSAMHKYAPASDAADDSAYAKYGERKTSPVAQDPLTLDRQQPHEDTSLNNSWQDTHGHSASQKKPRPNGTTPANKAGTHSRELEDSNQVQPPSITPLDLRGLKK